MWCIKQYLANKSNILMVNQCEIYIAVHYHEHDCVSHWIIVVMI